MPNVKIDNVTLAFTQNMEKVSDFGGYNYSFIINRARWCKLVRETLMTQKKQLWDASKNTDKFILDKTGARGKSEVQYQPVADMMAEDDVVVAVKSKAPIENSKDASLHRGTVANIVVDIFEFEYMKKQFICVKCHSERGCTIQPTVVVEYNDNLYFTKEVKSNESGIDEDVVEELVGLAQQQDARNNAGHYDNSYPY